jgi:hypothetical protein
VSCTLLDENLSTVVTEEEVDLLRDAIRFNRQDPVGGGGMAIGGRTLKTQNAQPIVATYDFDLPARNYTFADGAIALVVKRVPRSASVKATQTREFIFGGKGFRRRGREHGDDDSKLG